MRTARLRSIAVGAVGAVVAGVAAVAAPVPASAAAQCSLVMPSKVVVDAEVEEALLRLSSNCAGAGATHAGWHLTPAGGGGHFEIYFEPADFDAGTTGLYFDYLDDDPMGRWVATPESATTAEAEALTQNTTHTDLKYASRLLTTVTRTSTKLSWTVRAQTYSGRTHGYHPRARAAVSLWHLPTGSTTWKYVRTVTASSTGRASVTQLDPKAGQYRLGMGETSTVWAAWTNPVKGRV